MKKRKSMRVFPVPAFVFIFCMAAVTTAGASFDTGIAFS
jgi:hypothetical protein